MINRNPPGKIHIHIMVIRFNDNAMLINNLTGYK